MPIGKAFSIKAGNVSRPCLTIRYGLRFSVPDGAHLRLTTPKVYFGNYLPGTDKSCRPSF